MHSMLVCKDLKLWKNHQNGTETNFSSSLPILAIHSLTRSLQSIGKRGLQEGDTQPMDIATYRLNRSRGQCNESFWCFVLHDIYMHGVCHTAQEKHLGTFVYSPSPWGSSRTPTKSKVSPLWFKRGWRYVTITDQKLCKRDLEHTL